MKKSLENEDSPARFKVYRLECLVNSNRHISTIEGQTDQFSEWYNEKKNRPEIEQRSRRVCRRRLSFLSIFQLLHPICDNEFQWDYVRHVQSRGHRSLWPPSSSPKSTLRILRGRPGFTSILWSGVRRSSAQLRII